MSKKIYHIISILLVGILLYSNTAVFSQIAANDNSAPSITLCNNDEQDKTPFNQ